MEYMHPERLPEPTPDEKGELNYQDYAAVRKIAKVLRHPLNALGLKLDAFAAGMGMETMPNNPQAHKIEQE